MFTVDHNAAGGFESFIPGEYEVTVINYETKKAASGNNMLVFFYEVRSDVEQKCQGQKIQYDNFVVTEKSMWRFHQASKAAQFPNGMQFKSYTDWANEFKGKSVRVKVEVDEKGYPQVKQFLESKVDAPAGIEIADEDLPF